VDAETYVLNVQGKRKSAGKIITTKEILFYDRYIKLLIEEIIGNE
jgi:hypothetical protein